MWHLTEAAFNVGFSARRDSSQVWTAGVTNVSHFLMHWKKCISFIVKDQQQLITRPVMVFYWLLCNYRRSFILWQMFLQAIYCSKCMSDSERSCLLHVRLSQHWRTGGIRHRLLTIIERGTLWFTTGSTPTYTKTYTWSAMFIADHSL